MEYGPIPESRFEEVIEFLRVAFPDEPLNLGIGLCKKGEPCEYLESQDLQTLKDGLSMMATDSSTGQIAGVVLNGITRRGDVEKAIEATKGIPCPEYHLIFGLLNELNEKADLYNKYNVDEIFDMRILSVDGKYRGKGIAKQLAQRSVLLAEERNFKLIKTDATSHFTQKIVEGIGFFAEREIIYKEYVDSEGRRPYNKVEPPHDSYKLMVKQLGKN